MTSGTPRAFQRKTPRKWTYHVFFFERPEEFRMLTMNDAALNSLTSQNNSLGLFACTLFNVSFKNLIVIWGHYNWWRSAVKFKAYGFEQWEIFIVDNTCWDTGPRFLRSYLKDCPNIVVLNIKHSILRTYMYSTCIPTQLFYVTWRKGRRRYNHKILQLNTI